MRMRNPYVFNKLGVRLFQMFVDSHLEKKIASNGSGVGAQFLFVGSYLPLQLGGATGPEIRTVSPHLPAGGEDSEDLGDMDGATR